MFKNNICLNLFKILQIFIKSIRRKHALKALKKSPKALFPIVLFVLNGGHKEATLELLAHKLYNTLKENRQDNIIFFENLKLLKTA